MVGKRYAIRAIHREKEITVDMLDLPTGKLQRISKRICVIEKKYRYLQPN